MIKEMLEAGFFLLGIVAIMGVLTITIYMAFVFINHIMPFLENIS